MRLVKHMKSNTNPDLESSAGTEAGSHPLASLDMDFIRPCRKLIGEHQRVGETAAGVCGPARTHIRSGLPLLGR